MSKIKYGCSYNFYNRQIQTNFSNTKTLSFTLFSFFAKKKRSFKVKYIKTGFHRLQTSIFQVLFIGITPCSFNLLDRLFLCTVLKCIVGCLLLFVYTLVLHPVENWRTFLNHSPLILFLLNISRFIMTNIIVNKHK